MTTTSTIDITNVNDFHANMLSHYREAYGTDNFSQYHEEIDNAILQFTAVGLWRDAILTYFIADDTTHAVIIGSINRLIHSFMDDDATLSQLYVMRAVATMATTMNEEDIQSDVSTALMLDGSNNMARLIALFSQVSSGFQEPLNSISSGAWQAWGILGIDPESLNDN